MHKVIEVAQLDDQQEAIDKFLAADVPKPFNTDLMEMETLDRQKVQISV